jgi:hypothetical protein
LPAVAPHFGGRLFLFLLIFWALSLDVRGAWVVLLVVTIIVAVLARLLVALAVALVGGLVVGLVVVGGVGVGGVIGGVGLVVVGGVGRFDVLFGVCFWKAKAQLSGR